MSAGKAAKKAAKRAAQKVKSAVMTDEQKRKDGIRTMMIHRLTGTVPRETLKAARIYDDLRFSNQSNILGIRLAILEAGDDIVKDGEKYVDRFLGGDLVVG